MERKTIQRTFGDKTFTLPVKLPLTVLEWFTNMASKGNLSQSELMRGLMMRVVIEPKITREYLDNDGDIDDFTLMQALMMDITDAMDERVYELKKKL